MRIERTKNTFRSTIFGILNRLINLLIPFIIRTIIIKVLGSEYLGLNSLFTSILQVLSLSELGFSSAMVFSMYKAVSDDDKDKLGALLYLFKRIYFIVGSAIAVLGLVIIPLLPVIVDIKQLDGTGINLYFLYIIYLINTVVSYQFFAYKKSILQAYQRNDVISNINSIVHIILYISQIIMLVCFKNYYLYAICMPIFTIADNIVTAVFSKKLFPDIISCGSVDKQEVKSIMQLVKALCGHKIGAVIISSADSIVISAFLNLRILTIYSNYYYVITALIGFINIGYNAILAGVGNSIITETKEHNKKIFDELTIMIAWIVGFCTVCLLCLYQPFMELWMGSEYLFDMSTVCLLVIYFYTWQIRVIGLNFKDAAGMWKADFFKPYVGIVFNIVVNILLVINIGINGVLISTIIVMVAIYFPWETRVLYNKLFQTSAVYYYLRQLYFMITTGLACFVTYLICSKIPCEGFIALAVRGIVCIIVANGIYLIFYSRIKEFSELKARIIRVVKR